MFPVLGDLDRERINRKGRRRGVPTIIFEGKQVSIDGGMVLIREGWSWLTGVSGFYLSLPANTWGVLTHPNGTQQAIPGGLCELPPGLYKLQYIDQQGHHEYTNRISEVSSDGEKLTLSLLIHYRVTNPLAVCQIDRPVETLMANIETDLAQYIRIHAHNEIAENNNDREQGKIHRFFLARHQRRHLPSRAITIEGIEIKEFTYDEEYFNIRRDRALQQQKDENAAEELKRKREIERIHAEHNLEIERLTTSAKAEMQALQGRILDETRAREIELERIQMKDKRRHELLVNAITTIRQAVEIAGYSRGSIEIRGIIDELLTTIMSDSPIIEQSAEDRRPVKAQPVDNEDFAHPPLSPVEQKIKNLTNTLRNLLK